MSGEIAGGSGHGQVLADRYELLGLLGVGGMGCVYRARDRELDERVALKMLRRELVSDPTMLARFRQEVKLARRVTHPNVARTFDIGEHEGEKFLTMELVDGESLGSLLAREPQLSIARVIGVGEAVCAGLSAAHAAGVVHRDLKPDNVLVAKDGRILITDFGIARALLESGVGVNKTLGHTLGTPAYMAPEQVEGAADIDARADIYALGAMLFELLTGVHAWEGDSSYAVAVKRLVLPPPDPRTKRADIPDAMARVVLRCMARKPEDRYASTAEVAAMLTGLTLPASDGVTLQCAPDAPIAALAGAPDTRHEVQRTVAVLPFRNGGADDDYLSDGLTEDLIDTLSMGRGLRVRSRGTVMRFKSVERDPREIGRELDVEVVVEGSVRRAGPLVRVSVRLFGVSDGFQLWAKRFECSVGDVLATGDLAATAIAEALALVWHTRARNVPSDPIALDLFLRARHEYHKGWADNFKLAESLFREALSRAPHDPMISSGLAMALARRSMYELEGDGLMQEALSAAQHALATGSYLGEARSALGTVKLNLGESVGAAEEARHAVTGSPGCADAHDLFGRIQIESGQPREGILHLETALALEPTHQHPRFELARAHALLGNWTKCDSYFELKPGEPAQTLYWVNKWRIILWRRDVATAKAYLKRLDEVPLVMRGPAAANFSLAVTEHLSDLGRAELDRLAEEGQSISRRAFFRHLKAECLAYARDEEGLLEALEDADRSRAFNISFVDLCPLFDPYRKNPRFVAARDRVAKRAEEVLAALLTRR